MDIWIGYGCYNPDIMGWVPISAHQRHPFSYARDTPRRPSRRKTAHYHQPYNPKWTTRGNGTQKTTQYKTLHPALTTKQTPFDKSNAYPISQPFKWLRYPSRRVTNVYAEPSPAPLTGTEEIVVPEWWLSG